MAWRKGRLSDMQQQPTYFDLCVAAPWAAPHHLVHRGPVPNHHFSAIIQSCLQEVSEKMDAQASERSRQLAENEELRAKLDSFLGQFESFNAMVRCGVQRMEL